MQLLCLNRFVSGKAGYMAVKPLSYVLEVVLTFIGNATGAAIGGFLLNLTRLGATLSEKAAAITQQSSPIHRLVYLYWRCSAVY
mgnify:CR=1 FL=1